MATKKSTTIINHPSSERRVGTLARRFLHMRKEHEAAVNRMWVGTLALNFTDEELGLIPDLLCPNDQMLLKWIRDPLSRRRA